MSGKFLEVLLVVISLILFGASFYFYFWIERTTLGAVLAIAAAILTYVTSKRHNK